MEIADVDVPEDTHRAPRRSETNKAVLLLSFFVFPIFLSGVGVSVLGFGFWVLGFFLHPASPFISSTIDKAQEAALRSASVRTLDLSFPLAFAIGSSYHVHSRACPVSIDGYVVKGRPKVKILKLRIQLVLVGPILSQGS